MQYAKKRTAQVNMKDSQADRVWAWSDMSEFAILETATVIICSHPDP